MITDALDLINRQKEEIRRLKEDVDDLEKKVEHLAVLLADARHDAVKEFAERVKEKIRTMDRIVVYGEDIDNLVKEFTEGKADE
jgi:DNA repair ATPase RecN